MLFQDDRKQVVGTVLSTLSELVEKLGPDLVAEWFDANDPHKMILSAIHQILRSEHPCQKYDKVDHATADVEEDSRETEEGLYQGLTSLICALACTLGSQFDHLFAQMHPFLFVLASHKTAVAFRSIGLGSYADILPSMGPGKVTTQYTEEILPLAVQSLAQTADVWLLQNSCYCTGRLFELNPDAPVVQTHLIEALTKLSVMLDANPDDVKDEEQLCA
eukprot:Selendium_serpulae@DN5999_c0_g3_i2.p1